MANVLVWAVWVIAAFSCLASGIAVVSFSNPFFSALALIGNLASLAVLYLLLSAEFVAAGQVLVYTGAVMLMFLFVAGWTSCLLITSLAIYGLPESIEKAWAVITGQ